MGKEIKIECEFTEMVSISDLIPNELNTNKHPDDQIERLAELIEYYGVRHPIIVSKRSGKIAAGEGRFYAAKKLGMTQFPVDYQDFKDEEEEIAFITADNSIALWAHLDFSKINQQLADFSPDFNLDLLGIKNFSIDGGKFIDDIQVNNEINESYNFIIKCDDFEQLDKIRKFFGSDGSKINFDKAYECINN